MNGGHASDRIFYHGDTEKKVKSRFGGLLKFPMLACVMSIARALSGGGRRDLPTHEGYGPLFSYQTPSLSSFLRGENS